MLAFAAVGVPLITPVPVSILNPGGSPVALNLLMAVPPAGLIGVILSPTFSEDGAVYVGAVKPGVGARTVSVKVAVAWL